MERFCGVGGVEYCSARQVFVSAGDQEEKGRLTPENLILGHTKILPSGQTRENGPEWGSCALHSLCTWPSCSILSQCLGSGSLPLVSSGASAWGGGVGGGRFPLQCAPLMHVLSISFGMGPLFGRCNDKPSCVSKSSVSHSYSPFLGSGYLKKKKWNLRKRYS